MATIMQIKSKMLNKERYKSNHVPIPLLTHDYLSRSGTDKPDTVGVI